MPRNPLNPRQDFTPLDVVRLELGVPTAGLPNLIPNPSGALGTWGWVTPLPDTRVIIDALWNTPKFVTDVAQACYWTSEFLPLSASQRYVAARFDFIAASTNVNVKVRFEWYDASYVLLSSSAQSAALSGSLSTKWVDAVVAPLAAVYVKIRFDVYNTTNPPAAGNAVAFSKVMVATASASGPLASGFAYAEPFAWQNILTKTSELKTVREAMNLGTLGAIVRDSALDPATSATIRKGKPVRVTVLKGGVWTPIFTGEVDTASTVYDRNGRATITLNAVDGMQKLASNPRPQGVSTIAHLAAVLEGAGVPWNLNGSRDQISTAAVVTSYNENSSAADQVALVRDTVLGQAWLDRNGVVQVWSTPQGTTVATSAERLPNPSFDVNLAGWGTYPSGTLTRQTASPQAGAGYARVAYAAAGPPLSLYQQTPVQVGGYDLVDVRCWVRGTVGRTVRLGVTWNGDAANYSSGADVTLTGSWQQVAVTVSRPEGATTGAFQVYGSGFGSSEYFEVDTCSMVGRTFPAVAAGQYSSIDVDFNAEECINSVLVTQLVYNATDNSVEEVQHGPYENVASITTWGRKQSTFTVAGLAAPAVDGYAASILAANSQPRVRVNSATVPVKSITDLTVIDLLGSVHVEYSPKSIAQASLVQSIEHTITPTSWLMELGFGAPSSVASPQAQPQLSADSAYLTPYGRRGRISSAQTIGNGAWAAVDLTTADALTGGLEWDAANRRFVVRKDGLYVIHGSVRWTGSNSTGSRGAAIYVNGAQRAMGIFRSNDTTAAQPTASCAATLRLVAGDTVELRGYQSSGGDLAIPSTAEWSTYLDLAYIGA